MMPGWPNAVAISRLAVLRPMPGRFTSASNSPGTCPPCFASSSAHSARMFRALLRKKPVDRISASSVACGVAAQSFAVRYFRNSAGVTRFTRLSVHCAERIAATASCSGPEKSSSHPASG